MITRKCLYPMRELIEQETHIDVKRAISRCVALFASNPETHSHLLDSSIVKSILALPSLAGDSYCERFVSLAVANLALVKRNHGPLLELRAVETLLALDQSDDVETLRGVSFALNSFAANAGNLDRLEATNLVETVVNLSRSGDKDTELQSILTAKYLCAREASREALVSLRGVGALLSLAASDDVEVRREVAAALRNISTSDTNKMAIVQENGLGIITRLCRDDDPEVVHQALVVIASIAEHPENTAAMVEDGVLGHLNFSLLSGTIPTIREVSRALANLSSNAENVSAVADSGALGHLIVALNSPDLLTRRFAAMAVSNLAAEGGNSIRIIRVEGGLRPLISLVRQVDRNIIDQQSQQYALSCIANMAACHEIHSELLDGDCVELSSAMLKSTDLDLRKYAMLCLANLASNRATHGNLGKLHIAELTRNLSCSDRLVRLYTISLLRGMSTNPGYRDEIISCDAAVPSLLSFVHTDDREIKLEVLSALCNLSLGGCLGNKAKAVLAAVDMQTMLAFLCNSSDSTHAVFASLAIGNVASNAELQTEVLESKALDSMLGLGLSDRVGFESKRCIAYAVCNLSSDRQNRPMIIKMGGLHSIIFLCSTGDRDDMMAALSAIRGMASSPEARRTILEEGILSTLSACMTVTDHGLRQAITSIQILLSLNEENKADIIRSDEMGTFMELADDDNDAVTISQFCQFIGNISEKRELHREVLRVFPLGLLADRLCSHTNLSIALNATRIVGNISTNFEVHDLLVSPSLIRSMTGNTSRRVDLARASVLALANLCLNPNVHATLPLSKLVKVFSDVFLREAQQDGLLGHAVESKCYACLAVCAICQDPPILLKIIETGIISSLIALLESRDTDVKRHAVFTLNRLSSLAAARKHMAQLEAGPRILSKRASLGSCERTVTYSIGVFRNLCEEGANRDQMVAHDVISLLSESCSTGHGLERSREVASTLCLLSLHSKEARLQIVSTMMNQISEMVQSQDVETSRFALAAMANCAGDPLLCEKGVSLVPIVLPLLASDRLEITRESGRALAALLSAAESHDYVLRHGMKLVVTNSKLQDKDCAYNSSVAFRKLSSNTKSHGVFFSESCFVNAVMDLADHSSLDVQIQSAAALRDIASNEIYKFALKEADVISLATKLAASSSDTGLRTVAFGIIRQLSIPMGLKQVLVESGIVAITGKSVSYLGNDDGDVDMAYEMASALANLAEHAAAKVKLVQMGVIRLLVSLVRKPDSPDSNREVARCFALLSSAPENTAVMVGTPLPSIVKLLHSTAEEETCAHSASALSNIATDTDNQASIAESGAIPPLIRLLASSCGSCQRASCKALCRLASTLPANKASIFRNGGLGALFRLLSSTTGGTADEIGDIDVAVASSMAICNLSTLVECQSEFVPHLPKLFGLVSRPIPLRKNSIMILCNLTTNIDIIERISRHISPCTLLDVVARNNDCGLYAAMVLTNLSSRQDFCLKIVQDQRSLQILTSGVLTGSNIGANRAALLTIYNISICESSATLLVDALKQVVTSCACPDVLSRRYALMILANVALNEATRPSATRGGGLQAAVMALKDDDMTCRRFACICLANMGIEQSTQSQIVVHGGLPFVMTLCQVDDDETKDCALVCLSNLAANVKNHASMIRLGALRLFANDYKNQRLDALSTLGTANLCANTELLTRVGKDGVKSLIRLSNSKDSRLSLLALSSLRRLGLIRENRDILLSEGIVDVLVDACEEMTAPDILQEVASCLFNLSLSANLRLPLAQTAVSLIHNILSEEDANETVVCCLGAIANLAENTETHRFLKNIHLLDNIISELKSDDTDITRESARAIANLLSSRDIHPHVTRQGLVHLLDLSRSSCKECQYLAALCLRKLAPTKTAQSHLITNGLPSLALLTSNDDLMTKIQAMTALRDLCANENHNEAFFLADIPNVLVKIVQERDRQLEALGVGALRHLSRNERIKDAFPSSGIAQTVVRCVAWANEDLRSQIAGLFANLSEWRETHGTLISQGVVQALSQLVTPVTDYGDSGQGGLDVILQVEINQDCARTLANFCSNEERKPAVFKSGGLDTLVKLSACKDEVTERYAAAAIHFLLSSSTEVQNSLATSSAPFPFLDFSTSNLLDYQRAAASAFASMSANQAGQRLMLKKGGIPNVIRLCYHSDPAVRGNAVHSAANLSSSPRALPSVLKGGCVEAIKAVATTDDTADILRDASRALSAMSTDTTAKESMIALELPKILSRLAKKPDLPTQRFAALALCNLCVGTRDQKELVVKQGVLSILLFLLRYPDLETERCASLSIAGLTLGSDRNKAEVMDNGFICPLLEAMAYPDARMCEVSLLSLNGIALGDLPESKELMMKNGMDPLLSLLLKPGDGEVMHTGMYLLGTIFQIPSILDAIMDGESDSIIGLIDSQTGTGTIEIKRACAYILCLLCEIPKHHDERLIPIAVSLASLVDDETKNYASACLSFLASSPGFQMKLVEAGKLSSSVSTGWNEQQLTYY